MAHITPLERSDLPEFETVFELTEAAMGFVPRDRSEEGLAVEIEILGQMRPARLVTEPLFDPEGARFRD